jgi:hypothetical protein
MAPIPAKSDAKECRGDTECRQYRSLGSRTTGKNLTKVAAPRAKPGDPKFLMRACEEGKGDEANHERIDMP